MDDPISDLNVPSFSFSPEEIERIRGEAGVTDLPPTDEPIVISQPEIRPRKKRRGRPRALNPDGSFKYKRPGDDSDYPESGPESDNAASPLLAPAPLTKRDEREVASRLVGILTGATGMAGVVKPYLEMTDDEAKAIADPLASYLVRNADTIPVARQVLENYDLLAIFLGVMAYVIRVYRDRTAEIANRQRPSGPASQTLSRLEQLRESPKEGPENGSPSFVSTPYG